MDGSDHLSPVATEAGPLAVPITGHRGAASGTTSAGYPADGVYRDYHRRTVHDLKPWNNAGRPYDRAAAGELARAHARDFVERAAARLAGGGLLCCALDTELLGHWWYEGPIWLAAVLEEALRRGLPLVTVSEGLELVERVARALAASSWGRDKDLSTWDGPAVAELTFARAPPSFAPWRPPRPGPGRAPPSRAPPARSRRAVERLGVHERARARRR